jgi:hypothetical protein
MSAFLPGFATVRYSKERETNRNIWMSPPHFIWWLLSEWVSTCKQRFCYWEMLLVKYCLESEEFPGLVHYIEGHSGKWFGCATRDIWHTHKHTHTRYIWHMDGVCVGLLIITTTTIVLLNSPVCRWDPRWAEPGAVLPVEDWGHTTHTHLCINKAWVCWSLDQGFAETLMMF